MTKPPDPYASHLPVLEAVADFIQPKRVLEFGAGFHSTPLLLSLPSLVELVSIESDPEWFDRVWAEFLDQHLAKRFRLLTKPPAPADFDLVFIDDGKTAEERVETINWVLGQKHPPVVIHDVEVPQYAAAIGAGSEEPATGVVW